MSKNKIVSVEQMVKRVELVRLVGIALIGVAIVGYVIIDFLPLGIGGPVVLGIYIDGVIGLAGMSLYGFARAVLFRLDDYQKKSDRNDGPRLDE